MNEYSYICLYVYVKYVYKRQTTININNNVRASPRPNKQFCTRLITHTQSHIYTIRGQLNYYFLFLN